MIRRPIVGRLEKQGHPERQSQKYRFLSEVGVSAIQVKPLPPDAMRWSLFCGLHGVWTRVGKKPSVCLSLEFSSAALYPMGSKIAAT